MVRREQNTPGVEIEESSQSIIVSFQPINPFMNGLLAIGKTEPKEEPLGSYESSHSLSSPLSSLARPGSASPDARSAFSLKRESIGDEESGIDVNTVIGLAPSESPSSSGETSSLAEEGPIFNGEVRKLLMLERKIL